MKATTGSNILFSLSLVILFFALWAALAQPFIGDRFPGNNPAELVVKGMTRWAAFLPNAK